ncbi:MAG: hypothetical protein J6A05_06950, partial [Oscillospiraceae bacterium]|nr:hypothetical protein [Oscillospiraceae bacterium]
MPEGTNEVTTAVTAESVTTVIPSNEEVISQIASEAVSEAMENAGVSFSETAETNAETTAFSTATQMTVETENVTEITEAEVTESVTVLPPETAAVVTEPTAEVTTVTAVNEETPQQNSIPPQYIFIPLLIVILAFAAIFVKKNSVKSKSAEGKSSAKARDIARLEAAKSGKSNKKDKADKSEKEKKNLSKKVLDTIPYKKVLADNIWFLGKKMYSKAYTFDDINFNLADEEQQYMYLERY